MDTPRDRKYTKDHEWAQSEGKRVKVGITYFAQHELGDIVFADVPATGTSVNAGKSFATVESVKAVSDIYAPLDGVVVERNEKLSQSPELINQDPYGEGWLVVLEVPESASQNNLMDASAYDKLISQS